MKKLMMVLLFSPLLALASSVSTLQAQPPGELRPLNPPTYPDPHRPGSYYDWGTGQNGWGYCYQWTNYGQVMNGGQAVANHLCESRNPSFFEWGTGQNGFGYCYQWTPYGVGMNMGQPVANYQCESRRPSYYAWGRGGNGYTYCYQYTPFGVPMNMGQPVSNYNCQR